MSKEEYLKGERKIQARQIIKTGLAVRMRPKEILEQLAKKGIDVSERTLRRLKLEIYKDSGNSVREIYSNNVAGTLVDELLTYEEIERRCWELYYDAKIPSDKFKAMSLLRKTTQDKLKIIQYFPILSRSKEIDYTKIRDDLADLDPEGDIQNKED